MAHQSVPALAKWLCERKLLTQAQADELRRTPLPPDLGAFLKLLVQRGWLTPFQANQILQGHGELLVLDHYYLLERVGEGARGQVFKARHARLGRLAALKILDPQHLDNPRSVERFHREIRTAAQLDHPNIVKSYDAGVDESGERHYLAMEWVDGMDLARLVREHGPLPVPLACDFIRQVAVGLEHAHQKGIVHRDIKPANLLMAKLPVASGGREPPDVDAPFSGDLHPPLAVTVKILDFGLARFESEQEQRLTQVGRALGTVDYVAPEQVENARGADIRADIYSLGCAWWFLLTGQPPFPGESIIDRVTARLKGQMPRIRDARPDVPAAIEQVLNKMLARFAKERYQTPAELIGALESLQRSETVAATSAKTFVDVESTQIAVSPVTSAGAAAGHHPASVFAELTADATDSVIRYSPATVRDLRPRSTPAALAGTLKMLSGRQALYVAVGGALVLVVVLLAVVLSRPGGGVKTGTFSIMPLGAVSVDAGSSAVLTVKISRDRYSGRVEIRLADLPEDLHSMPAHLDGGATEVALTVRADRDAADARCTVAVLALAAHVRAESKVQLSVRAASVKLPAKLSANELQKRLRDPDPAVRVAAVDALARLGPKLRPTMPVLLQALRSPEATVTFRRTVVRAIEPILEHHDDKAATALEEAARSRDPELRFLAAQALARIGGEWHSVAAPLLGEALQVPERRLSAARLLRKMGPHAAPALVPLLVARADADKAVRDAIDDALQILVETADARQRVHALIDDRATAEPVRAAAMAWLKTLR